MSEATPNAESRGIAAEMQGAYARLVEEARARHAKANEHERQDADDLRRRLGERPPWHRPLALQRWFRRASGWIGHAEEENDFVGSVLVELFFVAVCAALCAASIAWRNNLLTAFMSALIVVLTVVIVDDVVQARRLVVDLKAELSRLDRLIAEPPEAKLMGRYVSREFDALAEMPTGNLRERIRAARKWYDDFCSLVGTAIEEGDGQRFEQAERMLEQVEGWRKVIVDVDRGFRCAMGHIDRATPDKKDQLANLFSKHLELCGECAHLWKSLKRGHDDDGRPFTLRDMAEKGGEQALAYRIGQIGNELSCLTASDAAQPATPVGE